jgi:nitrite reductase/ring-hydroxylating ferredoxin subunit
VATEHYVADVADFAQAVSRIVEIDGRSVGVFKVAGQYYALPNVCFHQGGPLCEGKVTGTLIASAETNWKPQWVKEGEIVRCPWHSLEFDIGSGQCLAYPGRKIRTYPVKVVEGRILVILGGN